MSTILVISIVVFAMLLVLVTSASSLARSAGANPPNAPRSQEITPTPTDADASVPGSTDGIMWMGVVIALIVLVPMLTSRALWARQA